MARWTELLLPPIVSGWRRKAAALIAPANESPYGSGPSFVGPQAADYPSARGFASMLHFGFGRNAYLYRATLYTAQACAGIPWLLYDKRGNGKTGSSNAARSSAAGAGGDDRTEIARHPLLTLVNAKANAREGAARMWIRTHSLLLLAGDVYLIALTGKGDTPVSELYAVRADRMKPELDKNTGELLRWEYRVGAKTQYYPPDVVRYLTEFSPEDDNTGLAPARVASRSVDQHNSANDWNTALLQNMARPSGMLTPTSPVVIPKDAHETLKADLLEKYTGPRNAGKPLVPRAPMDWKDMGTKPVDMEWLDGKTQAAREIAIAMAVPPELLGDAANKTYSNLSEARRGFYTETVLPRMDVLKSELNSWLLPLYGLDPERYELDYDTDDIEALQEDRQAIYDRAYKGWTAGLLTLDQALKMIGESEVGGDIGDIRIIPSSFVTLEEVTAPPEPAAPPALLAPPDPNAADSNAPALAGGAAPTDGNGRNGNGNNAQQQQQQGAPAKRQRTSKDETKRALQRKDLYTLELRDAWHAHVIHTMLTTGAAKVTSITETTRVRIKDTLALGLSNEETIDQLATRLDTLYLASIIPNRSETIARTEVISASNDASMFMARASGLDLEKEWIATKDDRTRDDHADADGQRVALDENFVVGGVTMDSPGNSGDPAQDINCRCTQGYHVLSDTSDKALRLDTEEQKAAHWRKTETTREQWYTTVGAEVKAQLTSERDAVMHAIAGASSASALESAALAAVTQQQDNWTALLTAVRISVGEDFAQQTAHDLSEEEGAA